MIGSARVASRQLPATSRQSIDLLARWGSEDRLPILLTIALGVGLVLLLALSPTDSGDYGQWLMASRAYLGMDTPDYRNLTALPPLVPAVLAVIRFVVPDPVAALHVLNVGLLSGLVVAFYLLGTVLLRSRWAGVLSVAAGLFVTDRFLELFAFGGLLQAAAMVFMALSVAAFTRAGRAAFQVRWWLAGSAAIGLAAATHGATGLIAMPVGLAAVALAAIAQRKSGLQMLLRGLAPVFVTCLIVAVYWWLVLIPANTEYVTNPAALAYRGPDRLFSPLLGQWSTAAVVALGAASLLLGSARALSRRRLDGYVALLAWFGVTWGAMLASILSGTGTDYPRFATLLLAPMAVAAAAGAHWLLLSLARFVREIGLRWSTAHVLTVVIAASLVAGAPLVVARFESQAQYYKLRDATSLAAASTWIDGVLPAESSVLTEVREGKWVEGLTGRAALFSQPVRYAFRRVEWQRSVDADALLRSTTAITSGLIGGLFTDSATRGAETLPLGLTIRANHGGEFVDLLRHGPDDTTFVSGGERLSAGLLDPARVSRQETDQEATVTSVWTGAVPGSKFAQSATVWRDGATMRLTWSAPAHRIQMNLRPVAGTTITSIQRTGADATVCFTRFGGSEPCLRVWVSETDARLRLTNGGVLRIASRRTDNLQVLITALTAGDASVGLGLLQPAELADRYDIGAALLYEPDPAYAERARRLAAIGFTEARAFGPYRVLLREGSETP